MATTNTKIIHTPIQLPGEARPMTKDERQYCREQATQIRQQLEALTAQENTLKMQISMKISAGTDQPTKFE